MGAVKWTWPELTDMHLCLGAARLMGGDAEEAKILYLKSYPNRDVPTQGMFIAIDLSLRTSGYLLSSSPSQKVFLQCDLKPGPGHEHAQVPSTLPTPGFMVLKPPAPESTPISSAEPDPVLATKSTPGSLPGPATGSSRMSTTESTPGSSQGPVPGLTTKSTPGPSGSDSAPASSTGPAAPALAPAPASASAPASRPAAGFLIVRSTGSHPGLLPGQRLKLKSIAPKPCSKTSSSSRLAAPATGDPGHPCLEAMPPELAADNQATRRAADVLKKYRIQRQNRGTLKPTAPKPSTNKPGPELQLRTIKPRNRELPIAPKPNKSEPLPRKSTVKAPSEPISESESQNQKPEKPVHCKQCNRLFPTKLNFERHVCKNHECKQCGAKFKWKCILERHMATHSEERPFVCEDCGKSFKGGGAFSYHRRTHTGERPFKCEDCGNVFGAKSHLMRHRKNRSCNSFMSLLKKQIDSGGGRFQSGKASGERRECVCETCGKVEYSETRLKAHMLTHTGERPFECTVCGSNFRTQGRLLLHLRRKHQEPLKCSECGEAFAERSALDGHMLVHAGETSYRCGECGRTFNSKATLEAHMRVHAGHTALHCSVCRRTFLEKVHLDAHMFLHTKKKRFECTECGKGFTAKTSLENHMRSHRGEKLFVCDHCGKSFASNAGLHGHKMLHTGEKPFVCSECGKAFIRKVTLDAHMRNHTGEKPFVCNECGKAFNRTSTLQTHKKLLHKRVEAGAGAVQAMPSSTSGSTASHEGVTLMSL